MKILITEDWKILVTEEVYDSFVAALEKAEADETPKPKLEALMRRNTIWKEET